MIQVLQQHYDKQHLLKHAFERQAAAAHPAFLALQRSLFACGVELTESILGEAREAMANQPGITIGQFSQHIAGRQDMRRACPA